MVVSDWRRKGSRSMAASSSSAMMPFSGTLFLISLLLVAMVVLATEDTTSTTNLKLTSTSVPLNLSPPSSHSSYPSKLPPQKGFFLSPISSLTTSTTATTKAPSTSTAKEYLTSTLFFNSTTPTSQPQQTFSSSSSSTSSPPLSTTTFEPLPQPLPQQKAQPKSLFKWNSVSNGQQNDLSYKLNCTPDYMTIEVNLTGLVNQDNVYVYLEKLKTFSICRPKMTKGIATFHLALDDNFYRCGTTKVHDQRTGTRVYYNRVMVESKREGGQIRSVYFKCSLPSASSILETAAAAATKHRPKRQLLRESTTSSRANHLHPHLGSGQLVNFTEIELPENFMEAEILDLDGNITARAPYPHLNLKVKRNGQFVNTSLNVAPGTPLEMIIYLDEESKAVYGLLASFLKVTDSTQAQLRAPANPSSPPKEEVIVLNGCSIDPYIFGNFETVDGGDSLSAKFRAFKFPESNYVMFVGTVNVCLDQCTGVPCGGETVAFGRRRRRRRSVPAELPRDPNKVFEIEMTTYLQIGYTADEEAAMNRKRRERGDSLEASYQAPGSSSKLTTSQQQQPTNAHLPTSSKLINSASVVTSACKYYYFLVSILVAATFSLLVHC